MKDHHENGAPREERERLEGLARDRDVPAQQPILVDVQEPLAGAVGSPLS